MELKAIVKFLYVQWVTIIEYKFSVLKLVVVENSSHGPNFKVTLYSVYPLLSEFSVYWYNKIAKSWLLTDIYVFT